MMYGLYLSAQGADAAAFHQSVLANNLANARTTGFKRDLPVFRADAAFEAARQLPPAGPETFDHQTGGISVDGTVTDFTQGPLMTTNGQFDIALVGRGFLEVNRNGQRFLTRNGKLSLNDQQQLVMADMNLPVLDVSGQPIEVPTTMTKLEISADGVINSIDAGNARTDLGQLALVEPQFYEQLIKEGDSLYTNLGKAQPASAARLRQGMLEEAEVDPVTGMVDVIQSSRGFEMNMNMIRTQDEMMAGLLQSVGKR